MNKSSNIMTKNFNRPASIFLNKVKYVKMSDNSKIKPNDLGGGLRKIINDLKDYYRGTLLANISLAKENVVDHKYSDHVLRNNINTKFRVDSLFVFDKDITEEQKQKTILESRETIFIFLREYRNACYAGDVYRVQKLSAAFFSSGYENNTHFRGQCFHLMENICNNSDIPKLVSAKDFAFGVLYFMNPKFDPEKLQNIYISEEAEMLGRSVFKVSSEIIVTCALATKDKEKDYYLTNDQSVEEMVSQLESEGFMLNGNGPQINSDLLIVDQENKTFSIREIKTTYPGLSNIDTGRNKTYNMGALGQKIYSKFCQDWKNKYIDIIEKKLEQNISDDKKEFLLKLKQDVKNGVVEPFDVSKYYITGFNVVTSSDIENAINND